MYFRNPMAAIIILSAGISCAPEPPVQEKVVEFPSAVAATIEGDWEPCDAVEKILGKRTFDIEFPRYSFRKDEKAFARFSAESRAGFKETKLEYSFIGWLTKHNDKESSEYPFVVTEFKCNIFILFGPEKNDPPTFFHIHRLVTVVNGATRDADLLFLAYRPGDTFAAFQRVKKKN